MNKFLENSISTIISSLGDKIGQFLLDVASFAKNAVDVIQQCIKHKEQREIDKKESKTENEIRDLCNKGSLDDLLRKFNKTSILLICLALAGCHTAHESNIIVTNDWEGHFYDVESFYKATRNVKLDKGESIWILSNFTLSQIILNNQKGN